MLTEEEKEDLEEGIAETLNQRVYAWDNSSIDDFLKSWIGKMKQKWQNEVEEKISKLEQIRCEEMKQKWQREEREKLRRIIDNRLAYCRQQNGLPNCKNCGLTLKDLDQLNKE